LLLLLLYVRSTSVLRHLVRKNLVAGRRQRGEEHLGEEIVVEEEARSAWVGICLGWRRSSSGMLLGEEELPGPEEIVLQDAPGRGAA
jgi:hypothetical protein